MEPKKNFFINNFTIEHLNIQIKKKKMINIYV